jgi:SMP-30/Gluconolactonase/LRE-like region
LQPLLTRACLVACLLLACASKRVAGPIMDCEPLGNARPVCGFQNPEDLAELPGGAAILVSEYAGMQGEAVGDLAILVLASDERRVLFRGVDPAARPTQGWGDATCRPPAGGKLLPHGIDLATRPDGKLALAVVQHAGRDSIELFEVTGSGIDWQVAWRGCVIAAADTWPNDVVWLPDGGLIYSSMMPRSEGLERMMKGDASPGFAMRWRAGEGSHEIPGTRGALANGVEVTPDGKTLYLNLTRANEVRRIDLASGRVEGAAKVPGPDNSTWAPDGRLLVASIRSMGQGDFAVCEHVPPGACPIPFAIVAVDPVSLETRDLYASDGRPGGLGTVGLLIGHEIFVGTASGDRVLRVDLEAK